MIRPKNTRSLQKQDINEALLHINDYWQTLTRKSTAENSTLIALPYSYIVPSAGNDHFSFEEQYYWDSYFTSLGIADEKLVSGMLENLLHMFSMFGMIPNANRYYFTSRSQPPLLTTFIYHVYEKYNKPLSWLNERIEIAKQEYRAVWMSSEHPHARRMDQGLSRYYDINHLHDLAEAESGWDMTPRFKRQCLDYLPVDLNCLLFKYEQDFAHTAMLNGDDQEKNSWIEASEKRKVLVDELLWNKRKQFYFDYNHVEKKQGKVWSLAAYYALWSGIASDDQAAKLVKQLRKFERAGGLTTTAGTFMYAPLFGSTKTQWAHPNGWAPLHYIVCEGLERYGYHADAARVATKWLQTCANWYTAHGEFLEKYNVVSPTLPPYSGVYPSQTGFGWTNSVFSYLSEKYVD